MISLIDALFKKDTYLTNSERFTIRLIFTFWLLFFAIFGNYLATFLQNFFTIMPLNDSELSLIHKLCWVIILELSFLIAIFPSSKILFKASMRENENKKLH